MNLSIPKDSRYVLGFMFSEDKSKVALISKLRPEWQKGFLNGIGGHKEENEDYFDAMVREFEEEAGVKNLNWKHYATMTGSGDTWECWCYKCFSDDILNTKTMGDEIVRLWDVDAIDGLDIISNLKWLIKLALDSEPTFTKITY